MKKNWDKQHIRNVTKYEQAITDLFNAAATDAAKITSAVDGLGDEPFLWKDYPLAAKKMKDLADQLNADLQAAIVDGVKSEWTLSNSKNSELCMVVFGEAVEQLTEKQRMRYFKTNTDARDAFIARKEKGLSLSDKVWNYSKQFKQEIEMALDLGIRMGRSADEISRDIRDYLKYPDKLFRRVRDEHGQLRLSQAAAAFHPGRGVYRSSYMNARRLAATETNIAYRTADYLQWEQFDFVVGTEIHLSNNHNCKGVPEGTYYDICDELQGKYPKDFKFTGWHPHCRCFMTAILKTDEEIEEDNQRILEGKSPRKGSVNEVKELPSNFTDWLERNRDRIALAEARETLPYFLRDNEEAYRRILYPEEFEKKKKTALEVAAERHAARTPEQAQAILAARAARKSEHAAILKSGEDMVALLGGIKDVASSSLKEALAMRRVDEVKKEVATLKKVEADLRSLTLYKDPIETAKKYSVLATIETEKQVTAGINKWLKAEGLANWHANPQKFADYLTSELANGKYRYKKLAKTVLEQLKVEARMEADWAVISDKLEKFKGLKTVDAEKIKALETAVAAKDMAEADKVISSIEKASTTDLGNTKAIQRAISKFRESEAAEWLSEAQLEYLERCKNTSEMREYMEKELVPRFTFKQWKSAMEKLDSVIANIDKELALAANAYRQETLEQMKARLGDAMPKTLEHLNEAIEEYEKGSYYGNAAKKYKQEIEEVMRKVFAEHDYGMMVKDNLLESILDSWFKNQFETGTSGGWISSNKKRGRIEETNKRLEAAHKFFKIGDDLTKDQLARSEYEKYGCLLSHDIKASIKDKGRREWQYGNVEVRFKKGKVNPTWTPTDSLEGFGQPTLCSDPRACSFDGSSFVPKTTSVQVKDFTKFKDDYIADYLELQYHGKLTIDCVESITFPYDIELSRYKKVAEAWEKTGVKVFYIKSGKLYEFNP